MAASTYSTPGVYVEIQPTTPPVLPLGTSTAAFIGAVDISDADLPPHPDPTKKFVAALEFELVPLTNFGQFPTKFGTVGAKNSLLAHAVFGFFQNGGSFCYVLRTKGVPDAAALVRIDVILGAKDDISIVAAPGILDETVQTALITHCGRMMYRIAVLDGIAKLADETKVPLPGDVTKLVPKKENNFGTVYFPWIKVANLKDKPAEAEKIILVPPSGHVAGIMARVDTQSGVHYPPANEGVFGAQALAYELGNAEQGKLNDAGVNVIRNFRGNIKVWGARTLADPAGDTAQFKYVNVQRTMSMIGHSIDVASQFAVFKPNNQKLWAQIKRALTGFLTNLWRDGALFGTQPENAFFIKVDESNNPPEVRELGRVIIEVGVAIVLPAEFVIFRIQQFTQITKP